MPVKCPSLTCIIKQNIKQMTCNHCEKRMVVPGCHPLSLPISPCIFMKRMPPKVIPSKSSLFSFWKGPPRVDQGSIEGRLDPDYRKILRLLITARW